MEFVPPPSACPLRLFWRDGGRGRLAQVVLLAGLATAVGCATAPGPDLEADGSGGAATEGMAPGSGGATGSGGVSGSGGAGATKFVGNTTTGGNVRSGFQQYWDQLTPENEGKWGTVQPSSMASFNWTSLDRTYAFTQSNGILFKQHTFVWRDQQPGWVNAGNAEAAVKNWMQTFCARYPNTKMIDVVNEAYHKTPSYIDGMGGTGTSGWDWVVNAFRWARAACPNAILILNDYNNIEYDADSKGFLDVVKKIVAAGAPVDAIGAQAHDAYKLPTATVKKYLDALAATGLPVYITEYDIDEADDTKQKDIMQEQFTMFWNHPGVAGITLWGYVVGQTWEPNTGLQQANGTMRPAMTWLLSFLGH